MSGKGARSRRQEKRAAKFSRGLVEKEDLQAVIGMCLVDAIVYAAKKNIRIRVHSRPNNEIELNNDIGPDAINVDLNEDDMIKSAKTSRRFI